MKIYFIPLFVLLMLYLEYKIGSRNEEAKFVGKLKQRREFVILHGACFIFLVSVVEANILTAFTICACALLLGPLLTIPYNGRYNKVFEKGWNLYNKVKLWLLGTAILYAIIF